ncbi:PASTA domain-containing protein [candidate division WOR-3 bacterium]|nr:PASTA domain-containing protein [candidate division WOR-3 bacterium]
MKKPLIYFITILVFFVIGILIANLIIMPYLVQKGKTVSVPNVCNLPLEDAIEELKILNLEGVVTERRYDQIIEEGCVIVQNPLPDTRVKTGRIINLAVSMGMETIKVPYLQGVDIEKGKLIIKKLGLTIDTVDFLFSDSIEKDKIIETIPRPEQELKKGDAVKFIVSKGLVLKMPNLVGKDLIQAKTVLKKMGLILGEIKEVEASGEKGNIIVQSPEPDRVVNSGDTVSVMVIK